MFFRIYCSKKEWKFMQRKGKWLLSPSERIVSAFRGSYVAIQIQTNVWSVSRRKENQRRFYNYLKNLRRLFWKSNELIRRFMESGHRFMKINPESHIWLEWFFHLQMVDLMPFYQLPAKLKATPFLGVFSEKRR